MKLEQLSKTSTLLAQTRNLLKERSIPIPPKMEKEIDGQLENYNNYMKIKLEEEAERCRSEKEILNEALDVLENRGQLTREVRDVIIGTSNQITPWSQVQILLGPLVRSQLDISE